MTLSSRADSSLSVVKLSSAEAKSSVLGGCFSSRFWDSVRADWGVMGEIVVEPSEEPAGCSATEVAESKLRAVLSSSKIGGLSAVLPRTRVRGTDAGLFSGRLA